MLFSQHSSLKFTLQLRCRYVFGRCRQTRASVYKHDPNSQLARYLEGRGQTRALFGYQRSTCVQKATEPHDRSRVLIAVKLVAEIHQLKVGALNVRSLGNKSLAVLDMITDNSLDLFAVVETWHDSAETPSVIASTPPEYQVFERSRPRRKSKAASLSTNHGGICVFVRAHIQVRKIDFPEYKAFEFLPLYVRVGALSAPCHLRSLSSTAAKRHRHPTLYYRPLCL